MATSGSGGIRRATHAGSWYSDNPKELNRQLTDWLSKASAPIGPSARAIISPYVFDFVNSALIVLLADTQGIRFAVKPLPMPTNRLCPIVCKYFIRILVLESYS
jgi:hypothetical protein